MSDPKIEEESAPNELLSKRVWRLLKRSNNWLLPLAIILFLWSLLLDHPVVHLAPAATHGNGSNENLVWNGWNGDFVVKGLSELAVAFFIAWIVAFLIEREVRERDAAEARSLREQMAIDHKKYSKQLTENVFAAMLGLSHEKTYIDRVLDVTLRSQLIRDHIQLLYELRPLKAAEAEEYQISSDRFVVLEATARYTFTNVSGKNYPASLEYRYPVRTGRLKSFNRVTRLDTFADGKHVRYTDEEIRNATNAADDFYYSTNYKIDFAPKGQAKIVIVSVLIKEKSDNEIWGTLYPTTKFDMVVKCTVPDIVLGTRSLTASNLSGSGINAEGGEWSSDGPILPFDSVVLWWRTQEDDSGEERTPLKRPEADARVEG
ncbi:MAG: hypothetical protein IV086_10330 [Hyphomonadaceae bacterium]|nr:hypothetical protein [Hyphomonadaceae bacterium]